MWHYVKNSTHTAPTLPWRYTLASLLNCLVAITFLTRFQQLPKTKDYHSKEYSLRLTCRIVKFSRTEFIMYFSGKCFSLSMKLIMYSHIGDRSIRQTKRPFSQRGYSVSTFSTTCLPNEHTFVEHVIVMFSLLSYLQHCMQVSIESRRCNMLYSNVSNAVLVL